MQYHFLYTKQSNNIGKEEIGTLRRTECFLTLTTGDKPHKLSKLVNTGENSTVILTTW